LEGRGLWGRSPPKPERIGWGEKNPEEKSRGGKQNRRKPNPTRGEKKKTGKK